MVYEALKAVMRINKSSREWKIININTLSQHQNVTQTHFPAFTFEFTFRVHFSLITPQISLTRISNIPQDENL
jgi:hypothetical protein